jgi:hypothetical protein
LQDAFGVGQEALADLGEANATPGALEQALTEVAFERLDSSRDGRLGEKQCLGGATEAALVSYLYEGFELT